MRNLILQNIYKPWMIQLLTLHNSVLVTGTKKLIGDAIKEVQVIAVFVYILFVCVWGIMQYFADENEKPKYKKFMKAGLIILLVIELIGTLLGTVGGYYGLNLSI